MERARGHPESDEVGGRTPHVDTNQAEIPQKRRTRRLTCTYIFLLFKGDSAKLKESGAPVGASVLELIFIFVVSHLQFVISIC